MIFQHSLDKVLSGTQTRTARIWNDYNRVGNFINPTNANPRDRQEFQALWSMKSGKPHRLHEIGQELSVQPKRTAKSVATIRVLRLWRQDIRNYLKPDIEAEGYSTFDEFFRIWCSMHDPKVPDWRFMHTPRDVLYSRPRELYTAYVMDFELVKDNKHV